MSEYALNAKTFGLIAGGAPNDPTSVAAFFAAALADTGAALFPEGLFDFGGYTNQLPDNLKVLWTPSTTLQRSKKSGNLDAMFRMGNNCEWIGRGKFSNVTIDGSASIAINLGALPSSIVLPASPGMSMDIGGWCRVIDHTNPKNAIDGVVQYYDPVSGALGLNHMFGQGSGTPAQWDIVGASGNCPIEFANVTGSLLSGGSTIGNWYVGPTFSAFRVAGDSTTITSNSTIQDHIADAVQNRGFYALGTVLNCRFNNVTVMGRNITNYGINRNCGNVAGGAVNVVTRVHTNFATVDSVNAHGIECGDLSVYCKDVAPSISTSKIGLLYQKANGNVPVYNKASMVDINDCGTGILMVGAELNKVHAGDIVSCGTGISVVSDTSTPTPQVSEFNSFYGVNVEGSSGDGVNIAASQIDTDLINMQIIGNLGAGVRNAGSGTRGSGRSFANSGGNIVGALASGSFDQF